MSAICNAFISETQLILTLFVYAAKQPRSINLKSNEAYGVHGKTRDTPTNYYDIVLDESKVEDAKEPLHDNVTEASQQPIDVTYDEVPGPIYTTMIPVSQYLWKTKKLTMSTSTNLKLQKCWVKHARNKLT